jgi:hypothetical protein
MNAPILITVYDREVHFKKTIESLLRCHEVCLTSIYIAIDGPVTSEASERQKSIKSYISNIVGFKSINVIQRSSNYGALKNSAEARKEIFKKYDQLIRTEDDNEFSPHFLTYMNEGLKLFKDDESVFAVCGYLEPIKLLAHKDTFLRQGFTSNGFGIWKSKFKQMESSQIRIKMEGGSFLNFRKMLSVMGYHVVSGLIYAEKENYKLMDYFICYYLYKNKLKCVFPTKSMVRNIGQDGSGLHSGENEELQNQAIYNGAVIYDFDAENDSLSNAAVSNYHKRSFIHTIYQYLKYIGLFK